MQITSSLDRFLRDLNVYNKNAFIDLDAPNNLFFNSATIEFSKLSINDKKRIQDLFIGFKHIEGVKILSQGKEIDHNEIRLLPLTDL